jgi:hypothetical protein
MDFESMDFESMRILEMKINGSQINGFWKLNRCKSMGFENPDNLNQWSTE